MAEDRKIEFQARPPKPTQPNPSTAPSPSQIDVEYQGHRYRVQVLKLPPPNQPAGQPEATASNAATALKLVQMIDELGIQAPKVEIAFNFVADNAIPLGISKIVQWDKSSSGSGTVVKPADEKIQKIAHYLIEIGTGFANNKVIVTQTPPQGLSFEAGGNGNCMVYALAAALLQKEKKSTAKGSPELEEKQRLLRKECAGYIKGHTDQFIDESRFNDLWSAIRDAENDIRNRMAKDTYYTEIIEAIDRDKQSPLEQRSEANKKRIAEFYADYIRIDGVDLDKPSLTAYALSTNTTVAIIQDRQGEKIVWTSPQGAPIKRDQTLFLYFQTGGHYKGVDHNHASLTQLVNEHNLTL